MNIKAPFNNLWRWAKAHPLAAATLLAILLFLCLKDLFVGDVSLWDYAFLAFWAAVCVYVDLRRGLYALALLMAIPSGAQEERPATAAPTACAVVVIVVGSVVVVKLIKFCNKAYARQTNSSPNEIELSLGDADGVSAASDVWFCGYCTSGPDVAAYETGANGETLIVCEVAGDGVAAGLVSAVGTREDFITDMQALGLSLEAGTHYSKDGQPAQQWDVPILFNARGDVPHVVISGDDARSMVVERSFDLATWTALATNTLPAAMKLRFEDNTSAGRAFYRVRGL